MLSQYHNTLTHHPLGRYLLEAILWGINPIIGLGFDLWFELYRD